MSMKKTNLVKVWDQNKKNQLPGKFIGKLAYGYHDGVCYTASRILTKDVFLLICGTAYNLNSFLYNLNFKY